MLKRFSQWVKKKPIESAVKTQRKRAVKNWFCNLGFNWCDIENLLFWKDPRVSLLVYFVATAFFWKFLSYKLQKTAFLIHVCLLPLVVSELKKQIGDYFIQKLNLEINVKNKSLGFDLDDVCETAADIWTQVDMHYLYLVQLKETKNPLLVFILVCYASTVILIFTYVPVAECLFVLGTLFYFAPVLVYLGVMDKILEKLEKLSRPVVKHWMNNQTKRRRNKMRKVERVHSPKKRRQVSIDTEDEENQEFLPEKNQHNEKMLTSAIPSLHDDSMNESMNESFDEFDLRGKFHRHIEEDNSSDYDESAFLPSTSIGAPAGMPSMSQFDSMMEPLDDEFHAGLNFKNVTDKDSFQQSFQQDHYGREEDGFNTDDDVDDIPIEQTDGYKFVKEVEDIVDAHETSGNIASSQDDFEYEFLDRAELNNVTDKEINEQFGTSPGNASSGLSQGVSNLLGYP